MKKTFSVILSILMIASVFALPAAAASYRITRYDLTELSEIINQYRKGTFEYDISKTDIPYSYVELKLKLLSESNCILLPSVADTENLKKGDIRIRFDDIPGEFTVSGKSGGYSFSLDYSFDEQMIKSARKGIPQNDNDREGYTVTTKMINGIKVTGIKNQSYMYEIHAGGFVIQTSSPDFSRLPVDTSDAKIVNKTQADNCYFYFETPDGFYRLEVSGADNFDTVFENFEMTIYPLTNGFVHSNGKTLYSYGGEFLKGWYKIGGKRYYFDEDGVIATGT
ncbi:MAG: hypothetical protein LBL87_06925, partial [Ruminococcus sp.]|nr:hypothetical protein [Ruminococcus sp.]